MKIIWSPTALKRVREIAERIGFDNFPAAARWIDSIFAGVGRLVHFPSSGRSVPEIERPEIREIVVGDYRVLYRLEPKRIVILTVRHGRQRFPN